MPKPKLLFISDLAYPAKGERIYGLEDILLSDTLRAAFDVAIVHPEDSLAFEAAADLILVRNSGAVIHYEEAYKAFRKRIVETGMPIFNSLAGKADQQGKAYLLDLYQAGFPVIPSVNSLSELEKLPDSELYVLKLIQGADSIGMRFLSQEELHTADLEGAFLQPAIDFQYELSFYFINGNFQYAMFAPDKQSRWKMQPYELSSDDLVFAQRFVDWNPLSCGIQRVDACRTRAGDLLLVELEDLNPYLSLLELPKPRQERFISALQKALLDLIA